MHHINVEFESIARTRNALRDFGFEEVRARSYAEAPADRPRLSAGASRFAGSGALPFGDEDTEGGGPKGPKGLTRARLRGAAMACAG
jgi:hypothetical protein